MAKAIIDIETTGLNPMEHRIVAIGVKLGDRDIILMDESEYYLLVNFWDTVEKEGIEKIIGFNIDFDWQFLKLRSLYHRLKIKHFRKYQGRVDLRQILNGSGGQYRKGTKLVDYCRFWELTFQKMTLMVVKFQSFGRSLKRKGMKKLNAKSVSI